MSSQRRQQRPRIVHITTVPFTLTFLQGQPRFMVRAGFEWSVVSSPGEQLEEFARSERVTVHAIRMTRRFTAVRDLLALVRLWQHLRRVRPHIVHAHTPKAGLLGMMAGCLARVPVRIYQLHGLPLTTATGWRRCLLTWSEKVSCHLAHQVLAVSHSLRELTVGTGLCGPHRVDVLRQGTANGVDARGRFDPRRHAAQRRLIHQACGIPSTATVLGFVGRLVPDQGAVEMWHAWNRLRDEFPELHLLVVGPPDRGNSLPEQIRHELFHDPRIHAVESPRDLASLYAAMDIVLLPTYREGASTAALEAAAMALPVIAPRVASCVDAIAEGVTGQLIPVRCVDSLVAAVQTYARDPQLRQRHGQAGRERVLRHFQPAAIWDALRREYIRLLRQQGWPESRQPQTQRRAAA